jgi:predicted phage-related endonuclease
MNPTDPIPHGTPDWHAARKGRITASMAPSILCPGLPGVFGTPLSAWLEITGRAQEEREARDDDDEEEDGGIQPSQAAEYGRATQDVHLRMLAQKAGIEWSVMEPGFYVSREHPWLGASPDAIGTRDGHPILAECKAPTNVRIVRELRHGIPRPYVVQAIVQMIVCEIPQDVVSVLYPPSPTWQVLYDAPELRAWVLDGLRAFWRDHVETDTPPPMDASWLGADALEAINAAYPPRPGVSIRFDEGSEFAALAAEFEAVKVAGAAAEKQAKILKARMIELSQGAERIVLPDGSGYTRREQVRKGYTVADGKSIVLRRVKVVE